MRLTRFTVSQRSCSARIGPRPAAPVRATARTASRFEHGPLGVGQVHAVEYEGIIPMFQAASVFMRQLLVSCGPRSRPPTAAPQPAESFIAEALDVDPEDVYVRIADVGPGLGASSEHPAMCTG